MLSAWMLHPSCDFRLSHLLRTFAKSSVKNSYLPRSEQGWMKRDAMGERACPRFLKLTPAARGRQGAVFTQPRGLGPTTSPNPVLLVSVSIYICLSQSMRHALLTEIERKTLRNQTKGASSARHFSSLQSIVQSSRGLVVKAKDLWYRFLWIIHMTPLRLAKVSY